MSSAGIRTGVVAIVAVLALSCGRIGPDHVPEVADIRAQRQVQPFIVHGSELTGVYRNIDVDALIFTYRTTLPETEFFSQLTARTAGARWQMSSAGAVRVYERFTPGSGAFSGSEEVRIRYSGGRVVVGWVQADHRGDPAPVSRSSEGEYAAGEIWPHFERVAGESGG